MPIDEIIALLPGWVVAWAPTAGILVAALWAFHTFRSNTRATHADLLLKLEESYRSQLPTLLRLEYLRVYEHEFVEALRRANKSADAAGDGIGYTNAESAAIDALEAALRHFLLAAHLRKLGVARRAIDNTHAYYLRMFVNDDHQDLAVYLRRYWATVYFWAPLAGRPWPVRLPLYLRSIPARVRVWALSKSSEPDRARRRGDPGPASRPTAGPDAPPSAPQTPPSAEQ